MNSRDKLFAINCFLLGITIVLLINSLYFMVVAKDLSEKVQIYEERGCYFYKENVK